MLPIQPGLPRGPQPAGATPGSHAPSGAAGSDSQRVPSCHPALAVSVVGARPACTCRCNTACGDGPIGLLFDSDSTHMRNMYSCFLLNRDTDVCHDCSESYKSYIYNHSNLGLMRLWLKPLSCSIAPL